MNLNADGRSQSIRSSSDDGKPSRSRPQERQNASLAQETTGDSRGRMTNTQIQAQFYLNDKKIFELFNFLIGHLLVDEPSDPIEYLHDLLDKCMLFRAGLCDPPLLFTARHVESMFQSLDPAGIGHISLEQYKAGMTTLGIVCYETNPKICAPGRVDKRTFEDEAFYGSEYNAAQMLLRSIAGLAMVFTSPQNDHLLGQFGLLASTQFVPTDSNWLQHYSQR